MTQVARFGRLLKVELDDIRVQVQITWEQSGSVLAGTYAVRCTGVETRLEVDADPSVDSALLGSLIHNAKVGCYAEAAIAQPVELTSIVYLNGEPFDFTQHPKKPPRP